MTRRSLCRTRHSDVKDVEHDSGNEHDEDVEDEDNGHDKQNETVENTHANAVAADGPPRRDSAAPVRRSVRVAARDLRDRLEVARTAAQAAAAAAAMVAGPTPSPPGVALSYGRMLHGLLNKPDNVIQDVGTDRYFLGSMRKGGTSQGSRREVKGEMPI